MMQRAFQHDRSAFTLIEVMAVVLIIALLSAACVLSLSGSLGHARVSDVKQQLAQADAIVRTAARQSGQKQTLEVDLDHGRVIWQHGSGQNDTLVRLPPNWLIVSLQSAGSDSESYSQTSGRILLDCSAGGRMPTYAMCLQDSSRHRHWMIAAGLSGQITWLEPAIDGPKSDGDSDETETATNIFHALERHELLATTQRG